MKTRKQNIVQFHHDSQLLIILIHIELYDLFTKGQIKEYSAKAFKCISSKSMNLSCLYVQWCSVSVPENCNPHTQWRSKGCQHPSRIQKFARP